MRPDLDALAALEALVGEGSVAAAAQRLHKVNSAVSYQVRKLEGQLGLALVDRSGYRLRLTPAGEAVLAEGRRLLQQAARLQALAEQLAGGWEARLLVVVDGILPLTDTLGALKTLADEGVPTRVQLKVEFLGGVQHCFEQEQADLMLAKDYRPQPAYQAQALAELECLLCVARGHPLARLGRPARLDELQQQIELTVRDSAAQPGQGGQLFGGERVFFLSGFVAKRQALLMGMGYGWMPRYLVEEDLAQGQLCELAFEGGSRYRFSPWLVRRLDRPAGRAAQRLAELLRDQSALATR